MDLTGKKLLITGGTGSFGNAVLDRFLDSDIEEIRIFSRDEKKQDDMRRHYQNSQPKLYKKLKYYIGDVRDIWSLRSAMHKVDYVFHAAALKQVPSCEFFPMEAVKTNIIGTDNVLTVAIDSGVKKIICLSTDKAAYPVNAMGTSKAMMEKIVTAKSRVTSSTQICCTRYGNVLCSRGSVVPLFVDQIREGNQLTVTDASMTRFIMTLAEAVDLVFFAFEHGNNGDLLIQRAPACTIGDLAAAVQLLFKRQTGVKIIGTRHGEKLYEVLMTKEEASRAHNVGDYYQIGADTRDLNYQKHESGHHSISDAEEYNSNNTYRLSVDEIVAKLLTLEYIRESIMEAAK